MYGILLYFVFLLLVSWAIHRKEFNLREYFLAGARNSTFKLSFSLLATILGASSTIGLVGLAYKIGLPASLWLLLGATGLIILGLIYPRFGFDYTNYTIVEYLRGHYKGIAKLLALIIFISWTGIISAQFLALARLFKFYFPHYDLNILLILSAGMVVVYTLWGGQKAVLFTDVIQFILFSTGLILLSVKVFSQIGNGDIFLKSGEYLKFPCNRYFRFQDFIYFFMVLVPVYIVGPDIHSRLFCTSNRNVRRKVIFITASGLIIIGVVLSILGIFARSLYPRLQPEEILYRLGRDFIEGRILFYLFLISIISLIFSSADTCLLTSSTIFVRDFLKLKTRQIFYTRVVIAGVGLIAILLCLHFTRIINLLLFSYSIYSAGILIPFLSIPVKDKLGIRDRNVHIALLIAGGVAFVSSWMDFRWGILLAYVLSAMIIFYPLRKTFLSIVLIILFSDLAWAQPEIELGKVTISEGKSFSLPNQKVIYSQEIPPGSNDLTEIIDNTVGVDLKTRGVYGIQSDIYVRGMGFEHNLIMIDGVPVNDPQTGHFNFDIPITIYDWKKIEIIPGCDVVEGNTALGGVVNIKTQDISHKEFKFRSIRGEKQLNITTLSFTYPREDISLKMSIDRKTSASYRPETDFETWTIFSQTRFDNISFSPELILGWLKKDFGADSFYSQTYPREEEHTRTLFLLLNSDFSLSRFDIKPQISYRRHEDNFILDRHIPDFYRNHHITQSYVFRLPLELDFSEEVWNLGLEVVRDDIKSTNLGKHLRTKFSGYLSFVRRFPKQFSTAFSLRVDNYSRHPVEFSPAVFLKYAGIPHTEVYFSTYRSIRIPSFTELYYFSPANRGNASLKPEKSLNFELGVRTEREKYSWGISFFQIFARDVIDWAKQNLSAPWQAENVSVVNTSGEELWLNWGKFKFAYTHLDSDYKSRYKFSKYVASYLRHSFDISYTHQIGSVEFFTQISYRQPENLKNFFSVDATVSKKINQNCRIFLNIRNLTNSRQEEIPGVTLPGRWLSLGMEFNF